MRRVPPLLVLLLACLVLGGVVQGPSWVEAGTAIPATRFTGGHVAGAWLGAKAGVFGTSTPLARWPDGASLRVLMWPLSAAALALPVPWVLLLAWTLVPAFNGLGGYALGRALGGSPAAAAVAGGLVAWSPWVRGTLGNGQLEQAVVGVVALVWAAAVLAEAHRAALGGVLVAVVSGGLAAPNLALAALVGLGGLAAGRVLAAPRADRGRRAVGYAAALALGAAGALVVNAWHAPAMAATGGLFRPSTGAMPGHALTEVATLTGLVRPAGVPPGQDVQHVIFIGWVLILVGVVAALRRAGAGALAAGALALVFAFGPAVEVGGQALALPLAALEAAAAIAARSGQAYRFVAATAVGLAVAGGLALGDRRWAAALVGLAWAEAALGPGQPLPQPALPMAPHASLVEVAGDAPLLDLPLARGPGCREAARHFFRSQPLHGRPLLHDLDAPAGYAMGAPSADRLRATLGSPACAAAFPPLVEEVAVIVLHDDLDGCPPPPGAADCLTRAFGAPAGQADHVTWWVR